MSNYYTPELEDLRVGYIRQLKDIPPPENDWVDDVMSVYSCMEKEEEWLKEGSIRTKRLDKEDIESLGWVEIPTIYGEAFKYKFLYKNYVLDFDPEYGKNIGIKLKSPFGERSLYYEHRIVIYYGNCPSINELKFLMKLLNIN